MSVGLVLNLLFARRRRRFPRTLRGWIGVGLLVAMMPVLDKCAYYLPTQAGYRAMLAARFHLPPSIDYEHFRSSTRMRRTPRIEAIVAFTPNAFTDWFTRLDDPGVWKPAALSYGATAIEAEYTAAALAWTNTPALRVGNRRARWGARTGEAVRAIRKGRYFCLAIQRLEGLNSPYADGRVAWRGAACDQLGRNDPTYVYLHGAVDFDTRRLMIYVD
ncbi:MAG: hypothetical protein R3D27_01810 [Hyphomicrobiaceae bacterium]